MTYRTGNYCAFYVAEPFSASGLAAFATKDFVYYNLIRSWKGKDPLFPFKDSHSTTYNVRDNSDWEKTLMPRLRERLRNSKNIILFLSERTVNSRALREEILYGINTLGLPVIVIYPDYDSKEKLLKNGALKQEVIDLWNNLPVFRNFIDKVPTLHIPLDKEIITNALLNNGFMVNTKREPDIYIYK